MRSRSTCIRIADGKIREITTFDARLLASFGLPEILPTDD